MLGLNLKLGSIMFGRSSPALVNKSVAAGAGSYSITGTAATLRYGRKIAAGAGSYSITGTAATLTKSVDPLFASVIFLGPYDGGNNGTTFTDYSPVGRAMTRTASAITSTTQQQFSIASLFTNGGNPTDCIHSADTGRLIPATGNFCVETRFYPTAFTQDGCMIGQWTSVAPNLQWSMWITGAAHDQLTFYVSVSGSDVFTLAQEAAGQISINNWYYGAFDWDGSKYRLFRGTPGGNASLVASSTTPRTIASNSAAFTIGCHALHDSAGYKGYLSQTRITNASRYGSDSAFAVPAAAFPRS